MTNYIGWTPPPGVGVVAPPVHFETIVDVIYSDGLFSGGTKGLPGERAGDLNWSAVGDGPAIVAYAIVEEYKPAPELREWFALIRYGSLVASSQSREDFCQIKDGEEIIHVREVLPAAREVVAWAVVGVDGKPFALWISEDAAGGFVAEQGGGTVVRLSGVMPNE